MHLLQLLAMLGATQGVLLLLLIGLRYRHRKNVPFALLLLTFSVRLGTIPMWNPATLVESPWILTLVGPLPLVFGPLVWWYVNLLDDADGVRLPRLPFHFVPWILETVLLVGILGSMGAGRYHAFVSAVFAGHPPWWMPARHVLKVIHGAVYAVLAGRIAFGRTSRLRKTAGEHLLWRRVVVVAPLASLTSFVFVAVRPAASAGGSAGGLSPFLIPAVVMMGTVYIFSMIILIAPDLLVSRCTAGPMVPIPMEPSGCLDLEDQWIQHRIDEALATGIFRDSELTLVTFAGRVGVHPNRLSAVINNVYGQNFCHLINRHRLDFFLRAIADGAHRHRTILDLAFDAGFPSKSTFNRIFKAEMGVAPSEFVLQQSRRPTEKT